MWQVAEVMDRGYYDNQYFLDGGWVDGLKYEDEVLDLLNVRLHPHPPPPSSHGLPRANS